jgi:hypothetical protein
MPASLHGDDARFVARVANGADQLITLWPVLIVLYLDPSCIEVDRRGLHAVETVQPLLDLLNARRAGKLVASQ